ncbi:hypothetical protein ACLEDI_00870 [Lonsdalea quercina]|uniref:hypothetical protein n=1 Tax=Lonsdalea quercina TaxID=71657 RepID=UPI00397702B0
MKTLEIAFFSDGESLSDVAYTVLQTGMVLASGNVSGKITGSYKVTHEVDASDREVELILHRSGFVGLSATASLL